MQNFVDNCKGLFSDNFLEGERALVLGIVDRVLASRDAKQTLGKTDYHRIFQEKYSMMGQRGS